MDTALMGLSAFTLTTFMLSVINLGTLGLEEPWWLVQVLAGMWEMAIGSTFRATSFTPHEAYRVSCECADQAGLGLRRR